VFDRTAKQPHDTVVDRSHAVIALFGTNSQPEPSERWTVNANVRTASG